MASTDTSTSSYTSTAAEPKRTVDEAFLSKLKALVERLRLENVTLKKSLDLERSEVRAMKAQHESAVRNLKTEHKKREEFLDKQLRSSTKTDKDVTQPDNRLTELKRLTTEIQSLKAANKGLQEKLKVSQAAECARAAEMRAQAASHAAQEAAAGRDARVQAHKLLEEIKSKERVIAQLRRDAARNDQCAVATGVFLTMANVITSVSHLAILLMQFKLPGSTFIFDDATISWIVTISDVAIVPGSIFVSIIIGKLGRKLGHLSINIIFLVCWLILAFASDLNAILVARFLQGFAASMAMPTIPILIGEYSSPKHRGVLITASMMSTGVVSFCVMTAGLYFHWQTVAIGCAVFVLTNILIVMLSPESPTWLIEKGRYDKAKKIFLWLREPEEENELKNMIEADMSRREKSESGKMSSRNLKSLALSLWATMKQREFYRPIIAMWHLNIIFLWCGFNCIGMYMAETITIIMNGDEHMAFIITTVAIQGVFSNLISVYITKLFSRKGLLAAVIILHLVVMLATAGYVQLRNTGWMLFDHPSIGIILIHLHNFTITIGPAHMLMVFGGEIFPVEFRSLAYSLTMILTTPNNILSVKTVPYFMSTIGFPGSYVIYATLVTYGLIVSYKMVPETKDKTLYDIEQEIKGKQLQSYELKLLPTSND